jgi:hypothetical protein
MVSAGIAAAVRTTSEATAIRPTAVKASAARVTTAASSTMAAAMLGKSELRNEDECCRNDAGEKYLQNSGIPHIHPFTKLRWLGLAERAAINLFCSLEHHSRGKVASAIAEAVEAFPRGERLTAEEQLRS